MQRRWNDLRVNGVRVAQNGFIYTTAVDYIYLSSLVDHAKTMERFKWRLGRFVDEKGRSVVIV